MKNKKLSILLLAALLCACFFPLISAVRRTPVAAESAAVPTLNSDEFAPITLAATSTSNSGRLYDMNDKALYFHRETKAVFNSDTAITYDDTSTPLYYDPETQTISNDKGSTLTTFDRPSSRGGKYLRNGNFTVCSIAIDDTFTELPSRDGGVIYGKYVVRFIEQNFNDWLLGSQRFQYDWFDFHGRQIARNELAATTDVDWLFVTYIVKKHFSVADIVTLGLINFMPVVNEQRFNKLLDKYPTKQLRQWLDVIDIVNPNAGFLNLKDDQGRYITLVDGQLFDYFDFPLVGADSRPVLYDGVKYFSVNGGRVLAERDGYLWDGNVKIHSVIGNLLEGEELYFQFMADDVTICPLYGEPKTDKNGYATGEIDYFYLDGTPIDKKDFHLIKASIDDIYARHPEMRPPDETWSLKKISQ